MPEVASETMSKSEALRRVSAEGFPLLARGGQAEILDCGDGKVLRIARRPQDFNAIRYEYAVYSLLAAAGLPAPRAHELVEAEGAPAIIMDRLSGRSMIETLARNPLLAPHWGRELARLHVRTGRYRVRAEWVKTTRVKAEGFISRSQSLSEETKHAVLDLLRGLPDGEAFCHGDFHPGNIILQEGKSYLIDWVGASRGDLTADVAHTYLLLRIVPRLPHAPRLQHLLQVQVAHAVAKSYLREVAPLIAMDYRQFSRWLLVNAAARTSHGLPTEQSRLLSFIERSIRMLARGGNERDLSRRV